MYKVSQVIARMARILEDEGDVPVCVVIWRADDVLSRAADRGLKLTSDQVARVLHRMRSRHDCEYGVSWSTIDVHTDGVLSEDARGPDENTDKLTALQEALALLRAAQPYLVEECEALEGYRDGNPDIERALNSAELVSARIDEFCTAHVSEPMPPRIQDVSNHVLLLNEAQGLLRRAQRYALEAASPTSLELSACIDKFCTDNDPLNPKG